MATKLTLSIEEDILRQAKEYAAETGSSLSSIVENYFKTLRGGKKRRKKFSPAVQELMGSVPLPDNFDYKEFLSEELSKKHLGK